MHKLAYVQAISYKVLHNSEGLETIEKILLIIAGVIAGAFVVGFAVTSIIGKGDGTGTGFGDTVIRKIKEI